MPTRTVDVPALVAHVPVDRFDIVDGPGAIRWVQVQGQLTHHGKTYVNLRFTLSTAASAATFYRALKVASIFAVHDNEFNFTAHFSGRVVSGVYDMSKRTGWFNLD